MTTEQKRIIIASIIAHLRLAAKTQNKAFSDGDVFFSLVFKTDDELLKIAKLCGV